MSLLSSGNKKHAYQSIEDGKLNLETAGPEEEEEEENDTEPESSKGEVFKSVMFPLFVVFIIYFTTLALWPPLVTVRMMLM